MRQKFPLGERGVDEGHPKLSQHYWHRVVRATDPAPFSNRQQPQGVLAKDKPTQ